MKTKKSVFSYLTMDWRKEMFQLPNGAFAPINICDGGGESLELAEWLGTFIRNGFLLLSNLKTI